MNRSWFSSTAYPLDRQRFLFRHFLQNIQSNGAGAVWLMINIIVNRMHVMTLVLCGLWIYTSDVSSPGQSLFRHFVRYLQLMGFTTMQVFIIKLYHYSNVFFVISSVCASHSIFSADRYKWRSITTDNKSGPIKSG